MDKEVTLKTLIVSGREIKNFSQRELARRIGLSNTSLNDLENGKVQKPDIEILRKIAEKLDLSLEELLKTARYGAWKNIIKEVRIFKYDILDWDSTKREIARKTMTNLDRIAYKLELLRGNRGLDYTLDLAIDEIKKEVKEL